MFLKTRVNRPDHRDIQEDLATVSLGETRHSSSSKHRNSIGDLPLLRVCWRARDVHNWKLDITSVAIAFYKSIAAIQTNAAC